MATEVHIGARLEPVAPKPVTDPGDRLRLLALLAVALAVHGVVLARTATTARDSIGFARYALQLEDPSAARVPTDPPDARFTVPDVLRRGEHPPGYPVAVLAASWAVRSAYHAPLQDQMLLSAQVASCVAAVLLVFPTYWLGRLLFGKFAGFAAALLFTVLPVPAQITSDGLTEGLFLLTLGTALLLGVRAVMKPGIGGFLLCGLATALSYLVRPEGLFAAAAVWLVVVGLVLARRWPVPAAAARMTALAVGVILPAVPYMVLIEGVTNKPTGIEMIPIKPPASQIRQAAGGGPAPLFADWYVPDSSGPKPAWAVKELAKESVQAFHYGTAALAVLGLVLSLRRLREEPWLWVLIAHAAMTAAVLVALGVKKEYLSGRHTLPLVYVGCLFAGYALRELPALLGRLPGIGTWAGHPAVGVVALLVVVATCVPKIGHRLHANREGHVQAGRYLAAHLDPGDTLLDPFEWAQFYAGRTVKAIPPDPPPAVGRYRWAVLEKGESPHSHLPRLQSVLNVANDTKNKATVEFWWPEGPVENARVLVYRQKITPEEAVAGPAK